MYKVIVEDTPPDLLIDEDTVIEDTEGPVPEKSGEGVLSEKNMKIEVSKGFSPETISQYNQIVKAFEGLVKMVECRILETKTLKTNNKSVPQRDEWSHYQILSRL